MAWSKEIQCAICGKTVIAANVKRKYCPDCSRERQRERARIVHKKTPDQRKTIGELMQCEQCAGTCVRTSYTQKYCRKCARERFLEQTTSQNERVQALQKKNRIGEPFVCENCGCETERTGTKQKFCKECAATLYGYGGPRKLKTDEDDQMQRKFFSQDHITTDVVDIYKLGSVFAELRRLYNVTTTEVARISGISVATISMVERGRTNVSLETVARLAQVYGVTVNYLLARSKPDT